VRVSWDDSYRISNAAPDNVLLHSTDSGFNSPTTTPFRAVSLLRLSLSP